MAIAKRPRKTESKLTKGFRSLSLNHDRQLREARERLKDRDLVAEGWNETAEALNEAINRVGRQIHSD